VLRGIMIGNKRIEKKEKSQFSIAEKDKAKEN
jgi:hypothetical protein